MSDEIKCPKCGIDIKIDEVIINRIREQFKLEGRREAQKEFGQKESTVIKQLNAQILDEKNKREEAEKKELELRNEQKTFDENKKRWELEKARQIADEKKVIEEKIRKDTDEEFQFKLQEKEKKIVDMQKALAEAHRKGAQGSMQTQGEVLELSLEELLKAKFPVDKITPVPKGISGADIIQVVYNQTGQVAGVIAWESKRTKNWTEDWIQKLKDDSRAIKADLCALVTEILPKEIRHVGFYNGAWVCDFSSSFGLASALRSQLIAVSNSITASTGKDQKMELLYNYLCSNTFTQRVQAIMETFAAMQKSLNDEKRGIMKNWALRETHIMRLTENTANMYGEIKGRAGRSLPNIKLFELNAGDEEKSDQSNLFD